MMVRYPQVFVITHVYYLFATRTIALHADLSAFSLQFLS